MIICKNIENFRAFVTKKNVRLFLKSPVHTMMSENINGTLNHFELSFKKILIPLDKNYQYHHRVLSYLECENYEKLRKRLDIPTTFIEQNIFSLADMLDSSYDYVFMSNISDYIGIQASQTLAQTRLYEHLNKDGAIAYAYVYDTKENDERLADRDYVDVAPASETSQYKDSVLLLKK